RAAERPSKPSLPGMVTTQAQSRSRRPEMHGIHAAEDEPMADINMIPLIDIALTLLIILMVTTAFIKHPGVSLKLPETATREGAPETNKDTTILVAATGDLYVDAVKQTPEALQASL